MSILNWLSEWYKSNCNGDWEHCYGIKIGNIDNPGWMVDIEFSETNLEDKVFKKIDFVHSDTDWYFCKVENNIFKGRGDSNKLTKILETFKNWVES